MKKRIITLLIVITLFVVCLCGCETRQLRPDYPLMKEVVSLANEEMTEYWTNYSQGCTQGISLSIDKYVMKGMDFSWTYDGEADYYLLCVSKDKNLEEDVISVTTLGNTCHIDDLEPGSTYYWKVIAYRGETAFVSDIFMFKTMETMKTVYIEGVTNTRDIGGVTNKKGQRVKYGMVFRGANIDGITASGKYVFTEVLGIKTDLDLRATGEGTAGNGKGSPAGSDVNYINVSAPLYAQIAKEAYFEAFAEEFRTFTKEENYPIYFHCAVGRDRTGTLAFILGAVLGLSDEDLVREYETTAFSRYGEIDMAKFVENNMNSLYNALNKYDGKTTQDKAVSYLKSIGITDDEIATVRRLLLE